MKYLLPFMKPILYILLFSSHAIIANEISKPFTQIGLSGADKLIALPNGRQFLSYSQANNNLVLWDLKTGKVLKRMQGHASQIVDVTTTADGKTAFSGSMNGVLKLWDLTTGKVIKSLKKHEGMITSAAISPDGQRAISSTLEKTILWNVSSGKVIKEYKEYPSHIRFTPGGKYAVLVGALYNVDKDHSRYTYITLDIKTGKVLKKKRGNITEDLVIHSVSISPNGKLFAYSYDNAVDIINIKSLKVVKTVRTKYPESAEQGIGGISSVSFSPDGHNILIVDSSSNPRGERISDLTKIELKSFLKTNGYTFNFGIGSVMALYDNNRYILATDVGRLDEINNRNGQVLRSFDRSLRFGNPVISIRTNKVIQDIGALRTTWNLDKAKSESIIPSLTIMGGGAITKDARFILNFDGSSQKLLFSDIETGTIKKEYSWSKKFNGIPYIVPSISFAKNNTLAFVELRDEYLSNNHSYKVWDIKNWKEISSFNIPKNSPTDPTAMLSADGKYVVYIDYEEGVTLFNPLTKEKLKVISKKVLKDFDSFSGAIASPIFTPDQKHLLVNSGQGLRLLSLDKGELIRTFKNINFQSIVAFDVSPNGKLVLSLDWAGSLRLWDLFTGKVLRQLQIEGGSQSVITFTPDGKRAIFTGRGNDLIVWDIDKWEEIATMAVFVSGVDEDIQDVNDIKTEWIITTPEGYFTGSTSAARYLNITRTNKEGMEPFDVRQLYDHFFRPDLVKLKLAGENISQYTGGLTYRDALKYPPPHITLTTVDAKKTTQDGFEYNLVSTKNKRIKLTFNIEEKDNGGIGLIRIYQEGKLIKTIGEGTVKQSANIDVLINQEKQDKVTKENQKVYVASLAKSVSGSLPTGESLAIVKQITTENKAGVYEIELELISGNNEISIEAFNKTNTVSSYREKVTINAEIPKKVPKLYAIVAGINEFEAPNVNNLRYSENDAEAIKTLAESKMGAVFDKVEVTYLTSKQVTKIEILNAANSIAKKANLEDTVLFYISTHGRAARGKLFLVPYNNKEFKNWINFEEVFNAVQSIKALKQIFVVDACESGKANDIVSSVYDSRASVLAKSSGVHVFLATTKGTSAFEHPDPSVKNGVFTHQILQALKNKGTDYNSDHFISVLELSKSLSKSANDNDFQHPVIRNVGNDVLLEKLP